jgi:hypothetical protein
MTLNISGVKLPALWKKIFEQTIFNENNWHFMILVVTLKETYFFFFYEGIFPVSMLDLQ